MFTLALILILILVRIFGRLGAHALVVLLLFSMFVLLSLLTCLSSLVLVLGAVLVFLFV